MKIISIFLILLAISCVVAVAVKSELIVNSISVAWSGSDNALDQLKDEINLISNISLLKEIAITNAELENRRTKVLSEYIVYFYGALVFLAACALISGLFLWKASNKRLNRTP